MANADLNFDTFPRSGGRATVENCVQLSPQTPSCFRPFALPSFTPEFLCRSHPSLDAIGVREKSEGKESLRRLASNTPNA